MKRETSIETYNKIKEEGLLSKLRFDVYEFLFNHGPMTCRELMMAMQTKRGRHFVVAGSSLSTRFSELERMGVVKETQVRPCKETGRSAIEWDVTSKIPIKLEKEKKIDFKNILREVYKEFPKTRKFIEEKLKIN